MTSRATLLVALAASLATSACRKNTESVPASPERTTSALTALTRTGWALSTCTTAATCGGTLANATDGNTATAWTTAKVQTNVQPFSAANTQFFKVDMLTSQSFVGIGLDAGTNVNNFPHTYAVEVSTDNTAWTSVATGTGTMPLVNVAFGAQTARYIRVSITATTTVPWSIAEFNVYATALPRTGWALSASPAGTTIANAIDGTATTKWSSGVNQASGQYFQVDMLDLKSINKITLDAGTSTGEYPHAFQVLVSKDGQTSTFTSVAATGTGSSQLVTITFPSVEARYLRIALTGAATNLWSIYELDVFGSSTPPTALPRTGWATAAGTVSSPPAGNGSTIANALDGSTGSRWTTAAGQAVGNYFQVDMLAPQSFTQLTIDAAGSTNDYPRAYSVFVSNDGTTWGSAIASGTGTTALVTVTFPLQNARYVKVQLTQAAAANWWSIAELNVYGPALTRNGWVATSSTALSGTNYQSNAVDGSTTTRWQNGVTQAAGQFFQLDMGTPETFTGLTVDAGTSTGLYPRGYQVLVSNDGSSWGSPIATGTGTTELLTIPLRIQTARYVRIALTGTGQTTQWAIQELNVWRGCGAGTCASPDQCHAAGVCDPVMVVCSTGATLPVDDSNPCTVDACDPVAGITHVPGNAGTTCRAATGGCDVAETCTGSSATCPADGFAAAGASCRAATGECDAAEVCAGGTPNCPADAKKAANTSCTDDGNPCTTDKCDGSAVTCQHAAGNAGTTCRTALGECDVAETCTGASTACPVDAKKAANIACTDDLNPCTTDKCDGSAVTCQHAPGNAGSVCRNATGPCDLPEVCTGSSATCPTDVFVAAGVSCRAVAGECDAEELCPGNAATCPADTKKAPNTPCTDDGNACTTDRCDGTTVTCQHAAGNPGTQCRAALGECDVAETCTGSSTTCPADTKKTVNTPCMDDGNVCTTDKCDGTAVTCQHAAGNAGTQCRAAIAGGCDVAETCTGSSTTCPADGFSPSGTSCRGVAGECDVEELCSGNSASCPSDTKKAANTACTDDGNVCTTDLCDGSAVTCQHAAGNAGTVCRTAVPGGCDVAETCNGTVSTCPTDVVVASGTVCRTAVPGGCDVQETCNGSAATCPADLTTPNGASCNDGNPCSSGDTCTAGVCQATSYDESCTGANGYLQPQIFQPAPGALLTDVFSINNAGTTSGYSSFVDVPGWPVGQRAESFYAARGGVPTYLPNPWPGGEVYTIGVNDQGWSAAYGGPTDTDFRNIALYHPDHTYELPPLPQGSFSATDVYGPTTGQPDLIGAAITTAGTLAVWHLDGDGQDAIGPSSFASPGADHFVPGKYGQAVSFDGSTCLQVGEGDDTLVQEGVGLTMMAWVKPDPSVCSGGPRIVVQRGWDYTLEISCNAAGHAGVSHYFYGHDSAPSAPVGDLPFGQWSHIAVSWDHQHVRTYVNGGVTATDVLVGQQTYVYGYWVSVGCEPQVSTMNFVGAIDEVALFKHPMGADQITRYMNNHGDYRPVPVSAGWVWNWSRYIDGFLDVIAPPSGAMYAGWSYSAARAPSGMMFGSQILTNGQNTGMLYTAEGGLQNINELLPPASDWDIQGVSGIDNLGRAIGNGMHNGVQSIYRMDLATHEIIDLGHLTTYPWSNSDLKIYAGDSNADGRIVGTLYDTYTFWPQRALMYTDELGLVDLNDYIDPASGWTLNSASAINESNEIVGTATNGPTQTRRAYRLKLPATRALACAGKAEGAACDDHDACTTGDACHAGACVPGTAKTCATADPCRLAGSCNPSTGVCSNPPNADGSFCDDGNLCTNGDTCQAGTCTPGPVAPCHAIDQCHDAGTCSPASGGCSNPPKANGVSCNDGNACTQTDTCQAGVCAGSNPVTCTTANPCQTAACDPAGGPNYPADGLVGLWHLDGNGLDSSDANDFSTITNANVVAGERGSAYDFASTTCLSQSALPTNDLSAGSGVTIAGWVKPSGTCPGVWPIFQRGQQVALQLSCTGPGTPGVSYALNTGAGLSFAAPAGSIVQGQWSFVSMTWDKQSQTVTSYVNGAAVASSTQAGALAGAASTMTLGCSGSSFVGTLDELALYQRALSSSEVLALAAPPTLCKTSPKCGDPDGCNTRDCDATTGTCSAPIPKTDGTACNDGQGCTQNDVCHAGVCQSGAPLACPPAAAACNESFCDAAYSPPTPADVIAQWHLDGNTADASGRGNNLTAGGGQPAAGRVGQALHFGATAACAAMPVQPSNNVQGPEGAALSVWVKPDVGFCTSGALGKIFEFDNEFGVRIACRADHTIGAAPMAYTADGYGGLFATMGNLPEGQWSHLLVTLTRGGISVLVNGDFAGGEGIGTVGLKRSATSVYLGCGAGATIDEATLYRRALSVAEMDALYNSPSRCGERPKACVATDTCHQNGTCDAATGQCTNPIRTDGSACSTAGVCATGQACTNGVCGGGTPLCAAPAAACEQATCSTSFAPAPPSNGLVGYWPFEGNTKDVSGHGLDLINKGAQPTGGRVGQALEFNGSACLWSTGAASALDLTHAAGVTMMAWVKAPPGPAQVGYHAIMGRGGDFSMVTYSVPDTTFVGLTGTARPVGDQRLGYPGAWGINYTGDWALVAVTWDHHTLQDWVNGQPGGYNQLDGLGPQTYDWVFNIGCTKLLAVPNAYDFFSGTIDEVSLYNRALTAQEIAQYYQDSTSPTHACGTAPAADGTACNDGNSCTSGDTCHVGTCYGAAPMSCPQPGPCQVLAGTCDPQTGCPAAVPAPNGLGCDDGNACTHTDQCTAGACVGTNPVTCAPADQCHAASTCDPQTGTCSQPSVTGNDSACIGGTFDYDGAGRLVRDHATTLIYDAYDQLRAVVPGPSSGPLPFTKVPVEDLALLPPFTTSDVSGINALGQVVGSESSPDGTIHAIVWSGPGAPTDINVAAGITGSAYGGRISASGTVLGNIPAADFTVEPFRFTPPSTLLRPGRVGGAETAANTMNDEGEFVGYFGSFLGPRHGFLHTDGGGYQEIPGFGGTWTDALFINDAGEVYGDSALPSTPMQDLRDPIHLGHAFFYDPQLGQTQDLNDLVDSVTSPGWTLFAATAANGNYVFGNGRLNGADVPFRLNKVTGEVIAIGSVGAGATACSHSTNHDGDVVGWGWKVAGNVDETAWAYVRGQFIDLNDVIDPASGWHFTAAITINDQGDIVGRGTYQGQIRGFRLRLPLRTAGANGPALAEVHTYGYDGLRTSTTTANLDGTNPKSQYWFSQDYTETTSGNREHYVRMGNRIVAKVTMTPVPSGGFVAPASFEQEKKKSGGGAGWPRVGLAALLLALGGLAGAIKALSKRRGWVPATAAMMALVLTATSCGMLGAGDKVKAALWQLGVGDDVGTHYFHNGIAPGPTIITNASGGVWEERRYEPFGQPIDAKRGMAAIGTVSLGAEPQNILGKLTDPNTGWSYHGARWMAPQIARWTAPDPAIKVPETKFMLAPWGLNPYSYASQSPSLYWDPSGLFSLAIHEEITRDAVLLSGRVLDLGVVNASHHHQDSLIPGQFRPDYHFDDSDFAGGFANVDKELAIYRSGKGSFSDRDAALGRALHGIQDFYAHTNFIDLYHAYAPDSRRAPTLDEVYDSKNSAYKTNAGFRKFILLHGGIESGDFSMLDPRTFKRWVPFSYGHGALNKDTPAAGVLHTLARGAATRDSVTAIQSGEAFQGRQNAPLADFNRPTIYLDPGQK